MSQVTSIYAEDETGKTTDAVLCHYAPASDDAVRRVLDAGLNDDGRSAWHWFRLQNGDLILGVFPKGDTYLATEGDRNI